MGSEIKDCLFFYEVNNNVMHKKSNNLVELAHHRPHSNQEQGLNENGWPFPFAQEPHSSSGIDPSGLNPSILIPLVLGAWPCSVPAPNVVFVQATTRRKQCLRGGIDKKKRVLMAGQILEALSKVQRPSRKNRPTRKDENKSLHYPKVHVDTDHGWNLSNEFQRCKRADESLWAVDQRRKLD